jgi:hypothetical protein
MLPDIGVGACGRKTVLQRLDQVTDLPGFLDIDEHRADAFGPFDLGQAFRHTLHHLVLRQAAQQGVLDAAAESPAERGAGNQAGGNGDDGQANHRQHLLAGRPDHPVEGQEIGDGLRHGAGEVQGVPQQDNDQDQRQQEQQAADDGRFQHHPDRRRRRLRQVSHCGLLL